MSNELIINESRQIRQSTGFSLEPRNFEEAIQFSKIMANSDIVPKDYKGKPENVLVAVSMGKELGLPPMQSLQSIAVINGKPSLYGDGFLAVVKAHPHFENINEYISNGTAYCTVTRRGQDPQTRSFSLDEAKKAGLLGKPGPWTQYTNRMLQMRARGFCCRDVFPDALRGINLAEEMQDITPQQQNNAQAIKQRLGIIEKESIDFRYEFSQCNTMEELKDKFDTLKKYHKDPKSLSEILKEKDLRKLELTQKEEVIEAVIEPDVIVQSNDEWLADFEGKPKE